MSWNLGVPGIGASSGTSLLGSVAGSVLGFKDKLLLWALGLLVVAFLGFGAYHWGVVKFLKSEIASRDQSIAQLTVENVELSAANLRLSTSIETQNAKIKELSAAQEEASKAADEAIARAQAETKKWKGKYQALWNSPRPTGDDCKDLSLKIDQYIELRKGEVSP